VTGPTEAPERHTRERQAPASPDAPASGRPARRWRRMPGRRTLLAAGALAVVLGAFGVWALYGSSWLRVAKVSVDGTRVLTERQVRAAADVPLGAPLASVDKSAVERRVREELRRVETVRAVRAWPHGVGLHVTERRPVLLQRESGADQSRGYVEVDVEGVRFATVEKAPQGVPFLVVEPGADAPAGHGPDAVELRRAAAEVVTALPDRVRRDARRVRVASYDAVNVELTGGRTVRWGSPEHGAAKAKALTAVMKAAKDAGHFDVSAPSAPAVSGG
jgi:cell division protein FtsQ